MLSNCDSMTEPIEEKFIFFPTKEIFQTPRDYGTEFKEFKFPSGNGVKIVGWLIELGEDTPLLLFFHGNAGNIGDRSENLALLSRRGISSFIIDYQGYGKSEGKPGELACYQDARTSYRFLREELKIPKERIFLFGRSLGGAVAVDLAQEIDFPAVILESTFTSFSDLIARFVPSLNSVLPCSLFTEIWMKLSLTELEESFLNPLPSPRNFTPSLELVIMIPIWWVERNILIKSRSLFSLILKSKGVKK